MNLRLQDLDEMSFADFRILSMNLYMEEKELKIEVDGAWIETENKKKELSKVDLLFYSWENIKLRKFDSENNVWNTADIESFEPLEEICEIEIIQKRLVLRGFGIKSNFWIEYEIDSPKFDIKYQS